MKQDRLTNQSIDDIPQSVTECTDTEDSALYSTHSIDIDIKEFQAHPLWRILLEAVKRNPLYPNLLGYFRTKILPSDPKIGPRELACKLSISIGEAIVLLHDIQSE